MQAIVGRARGAASPRGRGQGARLHRQTRARPSPAARPRRPSTAPPWSRAPSSSSAARPSRSRFPVPRATRSSALAEVQPPRPRRPQGGPGPRQGRPPARRRPSRPRARWRRPQGARAPSTPTSRRPRPGWSSCARRRPSLVGRGQPLGRPRHERALEEAAFALLPRSRSPIPSACAAGYAVLRVTREEGLRSRRPSRRRRHRSSLPCAAAAGSSSSVLHEPGARARTDRAERRGVPARHGQ